MEEKMYIKNFSKQGFIGKLGDTIMIPVMYLLQGNLNEVPQRTHRWNNMHLAAIDVQNFDADLVINAPADTSSVRRWFCPIPIFHMPILGGWKKFVVIEPVENIRDWHIGWLVSDAFGLSKIPIEKSARLGIGPAPAQYFGVDSEGNQIAIKFVGEGEIGRAGEFAKIPLL